MQDHAIKTTEQTAEQITEVLRELEMEALIGIGPDGQRGLAIEPEAIPDLDRRMRSFLTPFDIVKIKVFDRQTRIIYSTDKKIIGELNLDNPKLQVALSGFPVSNLETKDRVWDLAEEQRCDVEVVETYAPVMAADGRVLGAFEIYKDVRENLEGAHATLVRSVVILSVVLMAVFAALAALMHRASRIIRSHTRALEESRVELRQGNAMMVDALEREKRMSTELEATMEEFLTARKEAEAATEAKSRFLANMSHEIRTPMTAILGFADLLAEDVFSCTACRICTQCETRAKNREHIGTIKRNGEYLMQIINDILDLSKIEAGKLEVERIRFSPKHEVVEAVSLVRARAGAKRLSLEVEYVGPIPETIQGDPVRLRQILINLLGNAVKFTDEGLVRLVVRLVEASTEGQAPRDGPDSAVMQFDIVDSGIGMTPDQMGRLFTAFSQADASTTRKFGGTGLGLTISRRLAELLGGGVTVESKPGVGSTFRVTIATGPLDGIKMLDASVTTEQAWSRGADSGRAAEESAPNGRPSAGRLVARILLAEDGIDNQRLISFVLRKAGAVVMVVDNGQLAVDEALAAGEAGTPFDVILMDMQMPVLDGYEAARLLRKKGYSGPIIALTAHAMAGDREKCLQAGCDDYARKPIDREGLIAAIRKYLPAESPDEAATDHRAEVAAGSKSS